MQRTVSPKSGGQQPQQQGNGRKGPVPIDPRDFKFIAGGLPKGGWGADCATALPKGGW